MGHGHLKGTSGFNAALSPPSRSTQADVVLKEGPVALLKL